MKKVLIILLVLSLLLSACGGEDVIAEAEAIDIAFAEAAKYTTASIQKDSAVCRLVPENGYCYKVAFGGLIVLVDAYTGEVVSVMQAL